MKYDVALSFAGEDRAYVKIVAENLLANRIKVFYDEFEKVDLWGKDLTQHLSDIYFEKANFTVIFLSKDYAEKLWPRVELQSALARKFQEKNDSVLPARFDDTPVPGVLPTTGYIDLRKIDASEFSQYIIRKIRNSPDHSNDVDVNDKIVHRNQNMFSFYNLLLQFNNWMNNNIFKIAPLFMIIGSGIVSVYIYVGRNNFSVNNGVFTTEKIEAKESERAVGVGTTNPTGKAETTNPTGKADTTVSTGNMNIPLGLTCREYAVSLRLPGVPDVVACNSETSRGYYWSVSSMNARPYGYWGMKGTGGTPSCNKHEDIGKLAETASFENNQERWEVRQYWCRNSAKTVECTGPTDEGQTFFGRLDWNGVFVAKCEFRG